VHSLPREAPPAASQRERGFFCKAWPIFDFAAFSRNVYLIAIRLRACWRPWKISKLNQSHHPASGAGNNPNFTTSMLDSRTGRTFRMFECKCGNKTWTSEARLPS
jgi:hypothetical protein